MRRVGAVLQCRPLPEELSTLHAGRQKPCSMNVGSNHARSDGRHRETRNYGFNAKRCGLTSWTQHVIYRDRSLVNYRPVFTIVYRFLKQSSFAADIHPTARLRDTPSGKRPVHRAADRIVACSCPYGTSPLTFIDYLLLPNVHDFVRGPYSSPC